MTQTAVYMHSCALAQPSVSHKEATELVLIPSDLIFGHICGMHICTYAVGLNIWHHTFSCLLHKPLK